MKTRKQLFDLTLQDIMQYPSWEFALNEEDIEGQDEQTVRPHSSSPPLDPNDAYLVVRTSFRLSDGTVFKGIIKPVQLKGSIMKPLLPIDLFPVILTDRGRVDFWYGMTKPPINEISTNYTILGKENPVDVFPIQFSSDVDIVNGISEGTLEGFMYTEDDISPMDLTMSDVRVIH